VAGLADLLRNGAPESDDAFDVPDDPSGLTGDDGPGPADPDQLAPDPQPSRRSRKGRRSGRAAGTGGRATKADQDQVRDALTMLYSLPAWGLRLRDPHCGGALMEQRDDIVKALTPIVCRNPAMLAFFTAANAPWMDYLALFQALMPVGQMFWSHHVTHTVGAQESGEVPPVDLSAYSAPRFG
jgi:hypothetical protein